MLRRPWLIGLLLLSVGVNVGLLAAIAGSRLRPAARAEASDPLPANGRLAEVVAQRLAGRMAERLGLEGERRRRFVDLQIELITTVRELKQRSLAVRRELGRELTRAEPDAERAHALLGDRLALEEALERKTVDTVLATREILDRRQQRIYLRLLGQLRRAGQSPPGRGR